MLKPVDNFKNFGTMGFSNIEKVTYAEIAQLVERRPEKPCVPSSILGLGTFFVRRHKKYFLEKASRYPS